jgi:predicted kinase
MTGRIGNACMARIDGAHETVWRRAKRVRVYEAAPEPVKPHAASPAASALLLRSLVSLECAILVGLPGAGKSTFYRARLSGTHVLVSKDLYPRSGNRQARMLRDIARALGEGRSVAVDNTNPSRRDRAPIIELARACGARLVAYHVRATTREAVARNEGRTGSGRVPRVAIFTVARRLEPPGRDEGFHEVFDVVPGAAGTFAVQDAASGPAADAQR